jgi:membrane-associated phospholipid phosphatase
LLLVWICFFPHVVYAGDDIEKSGAALRVLIPATAFGVTLLHQDVPGALQLGKSLLFTVGATYTLKEVIHEQRPNRTGDDAFPSGHATISFASAEFLRKRYGWKAGGPAYAAATFVGYSRVHAREHHIHDVIAGAIVGIAISNYLTHPYNRWRIEPFEEGTGYRLLFMKSWG